MTYRSLLDALTNLKTGDSDATFSFLSSLSALTSLAKDEHELQQARDLLVRALERGELFVGYAPVMQALIRNVGLFPYLDIKGGDVASQLAAEAHRPTDMPGGIVFTTKQAEVYRELMAGRNVVLSAPTSFGKSLIIDAVIASGMHKNIVVVVPTLALVDETRRRLLRFSNLYKVITHLSQEPGPRSIFVHTQERVIENTHIKEVDFFVIDEFYKLQIDPSSDGDARSTLLNQAFYRLAKRAKQFYMLGPNIHELPDGFGENFRCSFIRTEFSTVASETHLVAAGPSDEARLKQLVPTLEGPTLVFSASPKRARTIAQVIAATRPTLRHSAFLSGAIQWLSENYHPQWGVVTALKKRVGIHHGKLPRSIAQLLVRLFNDGDIDFLVCTSTLIEGVNTAARNVVIVDNKIARQKYDFFTFNNIRGRSGRMWQHYVGHVYLFHPPPDRELEFVDVPMFTQGDNAPDALLVQLDRTDLSAEADSRLSQIWRQKSLSIETIKANSGFDPRSQIALAEEIEGNLPLHRSNLAWTGLPRYEQMLATLELACKHFGFRSSDEVRSVKQLAFRILQYWKNPSYRAQISNSIAGKVGDTADAELEGFLDFTRQWLTFRAPRLLSAVERIQAEVFARNGLPPGNYSFFNSQLESLFMNPVITALEEYGVPIQLGEKIVPQLGGPKTLDEAIERLRATDVMKLQSLSAFERDVLSPLCGVN